MAGGGEIGVCPRCGRELVRGTTPTGKVCFRCPSCGGVAVTLPALREALDAKSVADLTRAARAAAQSGCTCPGCGGSMSLLKVGDGRDKIEVDVCGRCLSVWCDKGEYETLAPPAPPKPGTATMRQLLEKASPAARERYAAAVLESQPEEVSPGDFDIGDILSDIVRLVIGAPTRWRDVKPLTPIFTVFLVCAMPVAQAFAFYCSRGHASGGSYWPSMVGSRSRDFWILGESMAEKFGFDLSSPLTALSFPFVQMSGFTALLSSALLFMPLAIVERRVGHARFVGLFLAFLEASVAVQALFAATGLATGRICGMTPIAVGFLAYISFRWPDMRIKDRLGFMSIYAALAGLWLVLSALIGMLSRYDYMSLGLGPVLACLVLGAVLGCRGRKPPQGDAAMP